MKKKYSLEVYEPGTIEDVMAYFESDEPFMNINKYDIINSSTWLNVAHKVKVLRVVKLEHFIWYDEDAVKHKIGVITEELSDTIEARFAN